MSQPVFDFGVSETSQEGKVLSLLKERSIVYNADFQAAGIALTARNRISALRDRGYVIAQKGAGQGEEWLKNCYHLMWHPGETPDMALEDAWRSDGWWIRPEEWRGKGRRAGRS